MAIVKMQRVCVIGLDNEKEEFMSRLMDFGVVELTDQSAKLSDKIWAENVTADESRDETARLEEKILSSHCSRHAGRFPCRACGV